MATILRARTTDVKPSLSVSPASSVTMVLAQESLASPHRDTKNAERGRRRSRSIEKDEDDMDNEQAGDGEANQGNSSNSDGPARKRRRSRKGLDKKFECPHDGCGKSYSRAEHL
jgi:hypothetical protein